MNKLLKFERINSSAVLVDVMKTFASLTVIALWLRIRVRDDDLVGMDFAGRLLRKEFNL